MIVFRLLGRAIVLAFLLLVASIGTAYAHGLPGSTLTFSQKARQLNLSVSFPLEDLVIASPDFKTLEGIPHGTRLSEVDLQRLSAYFNAHLQLQHESEDLALELTEASIETAKHHDVGEFALVASTLSFTLPEGADVFPLTLSYDVVMHEVRTHRAKVYWKPVDGDQVRLASFVYRKVGGKVKKYFLQLPRL